MPKGKLYIGTSGWVYYDWQGIFYPKVLPSKDKLKYFSKHFKTVEINYSFYHLPRPITYQNWYDQTPTDFIFAVKASRFITHIKRLSGVKKAWKVFIDNALNLKEKLGPILLQFPPSFKATSENIKRLEDFFTLLRTHRGRASVALKYAFEFRHKSWCDPEGKPPASYGVNKKIYKLLKKYNIAWVIADSPRYPILRQSSGQEAEAVTTDFVYIRMHGSKILFSSKYTKKELSSLAKKIKKWLKNYDVYCYFNNDAYGYAVENAKTILRLCQK